MQKFSKIFFLFFIFILLAKEIVFAGTLSCTTRTGSCSGGETAVLRMYSTSDSHAELPSQSNYNNIVCCTGVAALSNSCSNNYAVIARLSGATNAHVEKNSEANLNYNSNLACISVPVAGTVSVGYQQTDCSGFDTTIASMETTTNSHIGNTTAYATKICASAHGAGSLSTDIVDGSGATVGSPSISMGAKPFSFHSQTTSGIFGTTTQKIKINNTTVNPEWSVTIAATNGPTALWHSASGDYDFNNATSMNGQMTIDPSTGTLTPGASCNNTGISLGSVSTYLQGTTDSVTLISAGASSGIDCSWNATGIDISQTIPKEQPAANDYNIDMTVSIIAI